MRAHPCGHYNNHISHIVTVVLSSALLCLFFPEFTMMRATTTVAVAVWCVVAALVMVAVTGTPRGSRTRPRYIDCQSTKECGKGACCVIGMGRYSIPTCKPRLEVGESCRMFGEPANTTLMYPDGAEVELTGVFYVMCPCQDGLTCRDEGGDLPQCAENVATFNNHLYDYGGASEQQMDSSETTRS